MTPFQDRVAIVTGGGSGIGRALCQRLAREGAKVVLTDCDLPSAIRSASEIDASGQTVRPLLMDVTQPDQVREVLAETKSLHGHIDFLFNGAGIGIGGETQYMTLPQWRTIFEVNVWGVIHGTTQAYEMMGCQGSGHIVNISSLAGLVPTPLEVAYTASKYAVVGLSLALRTEAAAVGVKVSVVCPGLIRTAFVSRSTLVHGSKELFDEKYARMNMMSADRCAYVILQGVRRNKGIITVTPTAWILWRLYRALPGLVDFLMARQYAATRKLLSPTPDTPHLPPMAR